MAIIQTDTWLEKDFDRPAEICENLISQFKGLKPKEIYNLLSNFGMYSPSKVTYEVFEWMKKNNVWNEVERIFQIYKNRWGGPDIPIYIFPIQKKKSFLIRIEEKIKGGVSFPDKMFLFISEKVNSEEIEALFVHEYHHVCRLKNQNKPFEEYTLLDSIIIEGLAEYAVLVNCGRKYLASWCSMYSNSELKQLWNRYLKNQLQLKKKEREHDKLLFGQGGVPKLLGYAIGFMIVENFYKEHNYSTKLSFKQSAEKYITFD